MRTRYAPLRGMPHAPGSPDGCLSKTRRFPAPKENHGKIRQALARSRERAKLERAQTLAGAMGFTTSALVRLLLQLPAKDVAAQCHVVLDLACANRLYRELNQ